jgi:hypothetical protein
MFFRFWHHAPRKIWQPCSEPVNYRNVAAQCMYLRPFRPYWFIGITGQQRLKQSEQLSDEITAENTYQFGRKVRLKSTRSESGF